MSIADEECLMPIQGGSGVRPPSIAFSAMSSGDTSARCEALPDTSGGDARRRQQTSS